MQDTIYNILSERFKDDPSKMGALEEIKSKGYGKRPDGSEKGSGWLGEMPMTNGRDVATEMTIGVNIDGKETNIPLMVPTLSEGEKYHLLSGGKATREIVGKAVDHARNMMKQGASPYINERNQMPKPQQPQIPRKRFWGTQPPISTTKGQYPAADVSTMKSQPHSLSNTPDFDPGKKIYDIGKIVANDPSEIIKALADMVLMGTGDLLNKSASGYAGISELAKTGDIQKAAEAVKNYKAPEGPAKWIQDRPRSKAVEELFKPLGEGIKAGAETIEQRTGIPQELTEGATEFAQDILMNKGGLKAFKGKSLGLSTENVESRPQTLKKLTDEKSAELGLLRPGINVDGKNFTSAANETHYEAMAKARNAGYTDIFDEGYKRGWVTPDGKFLTPKEATDWLKQNDRDTYRNLGSISGLESTDYREALGLWGKRGYEPFYQAAKKLGIPAAVVTSYLAADDDKREKMLKSFPMLAALTKFGQPMSEIIPNVKLPRPRRFGDIEAHKIDPESGKESIHASPHLWDEPDVYEHIGKGQGAASFGEGLYSATSPGVQKSYYNEFKHRSPISVGSKVVKGLSGLPSKLHNMSIGNIVEALHNDPEVFSKGKKSDGRIPDIRKEAIESGMYPFAGMNTKGGGNTPYYFVRENGLVQPTYTAKGNWVIGKGASLNNFVYVISKIGNSTLQPKIKTLRDMIQETHRKPLSGFKETLQAADNIDNYIRKEILPIVNNSGMYYVDPNNLNAIAMYLQTPGNRPGWYGKVIFGKHIKNNGIGYDDYFSTLYDNPFDVLNKYKDVERVNKKPNKPLSVEESKKQFEAEYKKRQSLIGKLSGFDDREVLGKRTPQYTLKHAPEETYINHSTPIRDQHPYVKERLTAITRQLTPRLLDKGYIPEFISEMSGWEFYQELGEYLAKAKGVTHKQGRILASKYLNSIGIGGFVYPSSGMRNYENPNYVHFHDPKILSQTINK